jgi:hypothetical protein
MEYELYLSFRILLEYGDFDINITVQPIILLFHQGVSKPTAVYSAVSKID